MAFPPETLITVGSTAVDNNNALNSPANASSRSLGSLCPDGVTPQN